MAGTNPQLYDYHMVVSSMYVLRGERGELYQFLLEVKFLLRFNQENDR